MRLSVLFGLFFITLTGPTSAMVKCPTIASLEAKFQALADGDQDSKTPLKCSRILEPGGPALFCYRAYEFRSFESKQAFTEESGVYKACFGQPVATTAPSVNHPDSYNALSFDAAGKRLTISLKDKGALGKTLLTKRIADR